MIDLFDASKDYYSVLGVAPECELSAIKIAFRKLAREYHPDVSDHPLAKSRFQEVSEAYEVLSRHRQSYDAAVLALRQAAAEATRTSHQNTWQNTRASDPPPRPQPQPQRPTFGHYEADAIHGRDRTMVYPLTLKYAFRLLKQGYFHIPSLDTRIPFDSAAMGGKTFRFPGKGFPGLFGGRAGDYVVSFKLTHHSAFKIRGGDLYMLMKIPHSQWQTGGELYFDAPTGLFKVKVPPCAKAGSYIRFPHKGLPADRHQPGGHLYAKITIEG